MTEPQRSIAPASLGQALAASVGAGLASSLLIAVLQPQSIFGALMFLIAPLPLVIAGFSYHPLVAALAALVGCLFLDLLLMPTFALAYGLLAGLPAWLIAEGGTRRGRILPRLRDPQGYLTTGTILLGVTAYVSALIVGTALVINPSYEGLRTFLAAAFEATMRAQQGDDRGAVPMPEGAAQLYARIMPALMALPFFLMNAVSGYLGAKVARISQRLPRPWPDFRTLSLPAPALGLLALAVLLVALGGYPGLAGETLLTALILAYTAQGLAVVHFRAGRPGGQRWLISASWALIIIFGVTVLGFALLGLADQFLDFRKLRTPPPAAAS